MSWQTAKKNPGYSTAAWRAARAAQLKRDKWRCQLRYDGCQGAASEVDHIHGIEADPQHRFLRSVCSSCHKKRTAQQSGEARRGGKRKAGDPPPTSRIIFDEAADRPPQRITDMSRLLPSQRATQGQAAADSFRL